MDVQVLIYQKDGKEAKMTEALLVRNRKRSGVARSIHGQDQCLKGRAMTFPQGLAQDGAFRRPGRTSTAFPQAAAEEDVPVAAQQGSADGFRKPRSQLPGSFAGLKSGLDQVFEGH